MAVCTISEFRLIPVETQSFMTSYGESQRIVTRPPRMRLTVDVDAATLEELHALRTGVASLQLVVPIFPNPAGFAPFVTPVVTGHSDEPATAQNFW